MNHTPSSTAAGGSPLGRTSPRDHPRPVLREASETVPARARILLVGGEDSSGRAGLAADRETVKLLGQPQKRLFPFPIEGVTVPTAHTVQAGNRFIEMGAREPEEWGAEVRWIIEDAGTRPIAAKFGLLPGRRHLEVATELIRSLVAFSPVVLDPVAGTSTGIPFLSPDDLVFLVEHVLPAGPILTPNISEAALLTGTDARLLAADPSSRPAAAAILLAAGASGVILKGGHGAEDPVRDLVLVPGEEPEWVQHPRVPGEGIRGSGCRHATALALGLACGLTLIEAAREAAAHLAELIMNQR